MKVTVGVHGNRAIANYEFGGGRGIRRKLQALRKTLPANGDPSYVVFACLRMRSRADFHNKMPIDTLAYRDVFLC